MPIVGLTHEKDGRTRVSRTVTTKVAIGLPPDEQSKYPKKLDHFVFLKKSIGKEITWTVDEELQEHFGEKCKEFWIVFLDDDPDAVFRTEYAAYVKRGCWCKGDGEKAMRRDLGSNGQQWGELKVWNKPCANGGCREFDAGQCKPSGDLYFMLADFPSLGTVCRWHTSSYQSIRQVYSALQDLRRVTGGRLMGVAAKLFVHADKNVYEQGGVTKTGTKYVVGLELRASDLQGLQSKMLETAKVFNAIKGELNGQVLEIEEEDGERGAELTPEFYSGNGKVLAPEDPEKELRDKADELLRKHYPNVNAAKRQMKLSQYQGRMQQLIDQLNQLQNPTTTNTDADRADSREPARASGRTTEGQSAVTPSNSRDAGTHSGPEKAPRESAERSSVQNIHNVEITDDDLPSNMFEEGAERVSPRAEPARTSSPRVAPASRPQQQKGGWKF